MSPTTQRGYLILADITGFTPFVASTELEHSQEILQHMLKGIIGLLTPTFKLAEVEGDAVFVYSKSSPNGSHAVGPEKFLRKEKILEVIESVYYSFRDRKTSYQRLRTCGCKACQMAASLDLKFIVHYGDFIMNEVGGKEKPLGASVNVAHRLLKNHLVEATGWGAYALFTKDCIDTISIQPAKLYQQTESYEHIGDVETFSINLDQQYKTFLSERRVYLTAEEADCVIQKDFPLPPPLLWEWANDPNKRTMWSPGSDWHALSRPAGRTGKGATNHCVSSKVIERILDYKPFEYYTSVLGRWSLNFMLTVTFEEIPYGTRLSWHVKMKSILPTFIRRFVCEMILRNGAQVYKGFERLFELVEADLQQEKVQA